MCKYKRPGEAVRYGGCAGVWRLDRRRFDRKIGLYAAAHQTVRRFCILCANAVLQKTVGCGTLVLEFYAFLQKGEGACVREQAQTNHR